MAFRGKTVFISGASRGIGLAIACRLARDGANIVLAAKTAEPHPKLPGTIFSAAEQVVGSLGGRAWTPRPPVPKPTPRWRLSDASPTMPIEPSGPRRGQSPAERPA
jgi:NAD(P)-dependent dehydrogenase (short-subunit alcohol dehydrogenase family)